MATPFVVALSSWSCGSTAPDATPEVAAIVVSPASSTLPIDAKLPLQAQVQDGSGEVVSEADVVWTVQDPNVVSISEDGIVTALGLGTSQVAANALGKSGLATITVKPGAVATVTVSAPSKTVKARTTMQLAATATDSKGNTVPNVSFSWSSSSSDIAPVSASGVVSGRRPGNATITALTTSNGGKSGSVQITVK
jgi:large repetitive protein